MRQLLLDVDVLAATSDAYPAEVDTLLEFCAPRISGPAMAARRF